MSAFIATHRKAIVGALVAGVAAAVAAGTAGASWQVIVVSFVGGVVGIGVPVSTVPNRKATA